MNPTIQVTPDTGVLVAGVDISKVTGVGIAVGGVAGYMIAGKKHHVLGALAGFIAGFFAGRKADELISAQAAKATPPIG